MSGGIGVHTRPHRGGTDTWLTPPEWIRHLGPFDLDPCAAPDPKPWPTADRHYTAPDDDGMALPWLGFVWLNPPYGPETERWLNKLYHHGDGIALAFARTETRWFVEQVWSRADAVLFVHGRPHFHHADGERAKGNSGGPVCLIAYGERAANRLAACSIEGTFVPLPRRRTERGSSSLPAVLPPLVTALLLVLSVAYREPVRTLVWLTPLALLLLAVVVGCVWLAGRLTARPPMTEHLRDEAAVLIERSK